MRQRKYITSLGDTWDGIAYKMYPDRQRGELYMHWLLEANPQYRETVVFSSNISLVIPDLPEKLPDSLPPWKR